MLPDLYTAPASSDLPTLGESELPALESVGTPKPKLPADEAHAGALARGARCRECQLWGCGRGPVMPEIVPGAALFIVGEAPGKQEVEQGAPFVGASGIVLNRALQQGGMTREQVSVSNTILCRPPENKSMHDFVLGLKKAHKRKIDRAKATAKAAGKKYDKASVPPLLLPSDYCRPRLDADMLQTAPNTILAVGGMALQIVSGLLGLAHGGQKVRSGQTHVATIAKQHGAPVLLHPQPLPFEGQQVRVLMSSYHPAFAMRGKTEMMPIIESEIAKAARVALRGGVIDWVKPNYVIAPTADEAISICDTLRDWSKRTGLPVMVDIETDSKYPHLAKLRCVGIGGLGAGPGGTDLIASIPVRNINRSEYWKHPAEKLRVMQALYRLLNESLLAFQNGSYDTNVLFRVGLLEGNRNRLWDDTLLCHHDSDWSELPHDLGFMMSQFLEAPHHKDDADVKVVENASDDDLRRYNCDDVLGQSRLLPILKDRTFATGQGDAYRTDQQLAPIARDMDVLGICIDQDERIKHFLHQHARAENRLKLLRVATGREDFNPSSVNHVRDWLYEDLKLTPPFSTDGTAWEDVLQLQAEQEAAMAAEGDEIDDPDEIAWVKDPATSEGALQSLISSGVSSEVEQALNALLEFRGAKKLIGTYCGLRPVRDEKALAAAKKKGRRAYTVQYEGNPLVVVDTSQMVWESTPWGMLLFIHPHWNIGTVVSGRWSCSPNLMNIPERPVNMRALYRAVPGHVFVGADASQIELRLYTLFANDRSLWPMFLDESQDPHSWNYACMAAGNKGVEAAGVFYKEMMAKRIVAKKAGGKDKIIEHLRVIAKRFVYLLLYGGEKEKLFAVMSIERNPDGSLSFPGLRESDVKQWYDSFVKLHPELRLWQQQVVNGFKQNGCVRSILDFRGRFFKGGFDRNAVINFAIQPSAASLINKAMIEVAAQVPYRSLSPYTGPFAQVHDYIGVQAPEEHGERVKQIVERAMAMEYGGMPFPSESKPIAKSWSQH